MAVELILDWEDRIKKYDEKTQEIYRLCFKKEEELMKLLNDDSLTEWTTYTDDLNRNIKIEVSELEQYDGIPVMRAQGLLNTDVLSVYRCYGNQDNRMIYDPTSAELEY